MANPPQVLHPFKTQPTMNLIKSRQLSQCRQQLWISVASWGTATIVALFPLAGVALPPPEDIPEEVLRAEINLEARSPIDGKPMTPAEYAELEAKLHEENDAQPAISRNVKHLLFLLRLRKAIQDVNPL